MSDRSNVIPFAGMLRRQAAIVANVQAKTADRIATYLELEGYEHAKRGEPHEARALVNAARYVRRGDWRT